MKFSGPQAMSAKELQLGKVFSGGPQSRNTEHSKKSTLKLGDTHLWRIIFVEKEKKYSKGDAKCLSS